MQHVSWGTHCQFWWYYDYSFSIYGPLGQHGPDWSRDLVTLTFGLGGNGACCWWGSSSCIRIQSLKFVDLAIREIWRTMCVSINGPGDPDFWPFDLETDMRVASEVGWGTFLPNLGTLDLWVLELFAMYATDGQTDGRTKATFIAPFPAGGA